MYKPDKVTTERNAKILRELVKQPDNKLCADCKRNDPRWASWNLGVYLCIRCSGIHRGMGTHISRVKSIDLDMWTPEQMDSIQKWGNRRANLYWEAHLKTGHVPPDHKMESFIRSKYESRRWAMDGPPPADPSALEGPTQADANGSATAAAATSVSLLDTTGSARSTHAPTASLSSPRPASPSLHSPTTFRQSTAHSHSQSRQLLSAAVAGRVQVPPTVSQSPQSKAQPQPQPRQLQQQPKPQDDLFSLDFHAPSVSKATTPPQPPAKDVKQDILSLFSAPAPSVPPSSAFGQFTSAPSSQIQAASQPQPQQQSISMMGTSGTGLWGVSSGWTGNSTLPTATAPSAGIWGTPATTTNANILNTTDIWGGSGTAHTNGVAQSSKKDDVFGDLWGDFK